MHTQKHRHTHTHTLSHSSRMSSKHNTLGVPPHCRGIPQHWLIGWSRFGFPLESLSGRGGIGWLAGVRCVLGAAMMPNSSISLSSKALHSELMKPRKSNTIQQHSLGAAIFNIYAPCSCVPLWHAWNDTLGAECDGFVVNHEWQLISLESLVNKQTVSVCTFARRRQGQSPMTPASLWTSCWAQWAVVKFNAEQEWQE